ncbi:MAG: flagellar biosynthesis protein FliQ [Fimbriimonadia bacterium]|jgi:flagellar biosynthetic protein FliQ
MTEGAALDIGRNALLVAMMLSMPILAAGLVVGLTISVLQAITQVQEMTLSYVPKIIAVVIVLAIFGGWMLNKIVTFTVQTFSNIPINAP